MDLSDPQLGARVLANPKGSLPLVLFAEYLHQQIGRMLVPAGEWAFHAYDELPPKSPEKAIDEALPYIVQALSYIESGSGADAERPLLHAYGLLFSGSSQYRPGRGQPPTMRKVAVRAYVIRRFNPHPTKKGQSAVSWAKVADMLFENEGKCSRCGLERHPYRNPCVKLLMTAVARLKAAMRRDGIPV